MRCGLLTLLGLLVGLVLLMKLGREPLAVRWPRACSMNLLASRQDEPAKPLVVTVVSPLGDTMISKVFIRRHLR
jgi:hypothetical protein